MADKVGAPAEFHNLLLLRPHWRDFAKRNLR